MPDYSYHVVMNPNSGTALAMGLTPAVLDEKFAALGLRATIDADDQSPLADRIERAIASDAEVVVAAGGDGTATALAGSLIGTGKILALLPLGTANLLARDLAVPLDLDAALAGLADMEPRTIDVGEVNQRVFLHKVVVGFVPAIAAGRELIRGRNGLGAQIGFLRYFVRRIARAKRLALEIAPHDGDVRIERVQAVAVANNSYDEGFGHVFSRPRLDAGFLTLYVMRRITLTDVVRLSAEMLLGRWQEDAALQIETVREVTLRTSRRTIMAMIDGEVERLNVPLQFRIRPQALRVLAPVPAAEEGEAEPEESAETVRV